MPIVTLGLMLGHNYTYGRVGIVAGYRKIEPMYRSTGHTYNTSTLTPYVQHFYTGLRHRFGTETAALHIINFNLAWCADGGMDADDPRALQANGANTTVHLNRSNSVALVLDVKRWLWMPMPNNGSSKGDVDIAVGSK